MPRAAIAAFALIVLAGCGGDSEEAARAKPYSEHTSCFEDAGARFARDRGDVDFYFADLRRGAADHPGTVLVGGNAVGIEQWVSVEPAGRPYEWVLWAAHPLPRSREQASVAGILSSGDGDSYVAYLRKPSEKQMGAVNRCLDRLAQLNRKLRK